MTERLARRRYIDGATPLQPLPRLTAWLGGPRLFVKRDDLTQLGGGGNKVRKLEFLVADALAQGADVLITAGAVQSNHCRLTAAAAAREGLACRLVLRAPAPGTYEVPSSGNRLLDDVFGVDRVHGVPASGDMEQALAEAAAGAADEGLRPYAIPIGGSNALGAHGYLAGGEEILRQALALGLEAPQLVCATSSGGTCAGLLAAAPPDVAVHGICVDQPASEQARLVADLADAVAARAGRAPPERPLVAHDRWVGPGYAHLTAAVVEAVHAAARLEGLLLDPVYTGKAMAGLIGLVREGTFTPDEAVIFVHTGGWPALFAYPRAFTAASASRS